MKRSLLFSLVLFLMLPALMAQDACNPGNDKAKLRIFGDSWAAFPFQYHSYDSAFIMYGFPEYRSVGDRTSIISMNSEAFLNPLARIFWEPELEKDVRNKVDAMVLTLVGNDLAFKPEVGDSLTVLTEPFAQAKKNMDTLLDYIHAKLPDMEILWTCYDYPNFVDPLIAFDWNPYRGLWEDSGEPEPWQINSVVKHIAYLQDSLTQVWGRPYIHFFNNLGLMQFIYGQDTPQQVFPFGTYPARSVPFPGGDIYYTTPWRAMGLEGVDTYHLNGAGFTELAAYQFRVFFMNHFRKTRDTTIYAQGQSFDGWVSETGTTGTGDVLVGKNAGNVKIKGIFSFNTAFIPDGQALKKATLFIRRKGGNYSSYKFDRFPDHFQLDLKSGTFGSAALEASDYSEAATVTDAACFAGQPFKPGYSLRADLIPAALPQINRTGITQFRLEITTDTASAESLISFFNGDTTEFEGPFLDLYYDTTAVTGIRQQVAGKLNIFPNPAQNRLFLSPGNDIRPGNYNYAIYDEKGSLITSKAVRIAGQDVLVDISDLQSGSYIINLYNEELMFSASFVRIP